MLYFCNLLKAIVYIWWLRKGNFFLNFFFKTSKFMPILVDWGGGVPKWGKPPKKLFVLLPKSYKFFVSFWRWELNYMHHWLLTTSGNTVVVQLWLCGIVLVSLHNAQSVVLLSTYITFVVVEEEFCHVKNMGNKIISWHRLYWNLARCIWFYLVVVVVFTKEVISMNFLPRICFCSFAMFFF